VNIDSNNAIEEIGARHRKTFAPEPMSQAVLRSCYSCLWR
jgi:hypothetical protein